MVWAVFVFALQAVGVVMGDSWTHDVDRNVQLAVVVSAVTIGGTVLSRKLK